MLEFIKKHNIQILHCATVTCLGYIINKIYKKYKIKNLLQNIQEIEISTNQKIEDDIQEIEISTNQKIEDDIQEIEISTNKKIEDTKQEIEIKDEPTKIIYFENTKTIEYKCWKNKEGEYHREGGKPAFIEYNKDGTICTETYYINGKRHRDNDKPAYISYFWNGNISVEEYLINNKRHRDNDKPALIRYFENGTIENEEYWVNGTKVK